MEHDARLGRWIERYAGVALGAAFLSAVASRFGLWDGPTVAGRVRCLWATRAR
ncbi:MAG: hypothetical protein R2745_23565 [Vicinamibacterales bacterium]